MTQIFGDLFENVIDKIFNWCFKYYMERNPCLRHKFLMDDAHFIWGSLQALQTAKLKSLPNKPHV